MSAAATQTAAADDDGGQTGSPARLRLGRPSRLAGAPRGRALVALGPLVLTALALIAGPRPAQAHIVAVGVGSQTELRLGPRRIRVHYNLGFSSVLGLSELKLMDRDGSGSIDRAEQEAYLDHLGEKLVAGLEVTLDGAPQELVLLGRRGLGILGPIEQVAFDTWYELEVRCDLGPGPHRLAFHEGNFEGQTAEQFLWVPLDHLEDFARLETLQDRAPGPALDMQGTRRLLGRDLTIEFEFTPAALARDRAAEQVEPWLAGVDRAVTSVRAGLSAEVETELNALAFRGVQLGGADAAGARLAGVAPMVAQMARDRVVDADSGAAVRPPAEPLPGAGAVGDGAGLTQAPDAARMIDALNRPFSWAILALFFGWGAAHALLPGHGKTMVAAYLLGTRGRIADALRLGAIVTFTHTFALYTAGLALVYVVERYGGAQGQTFHERLVRQVTLLSGLGLIAYGGWLAWSRLALLRVSSGHAHAAGHGHEHAHADGTRHSHPHAHEHGDRHGHGHGHQHHDHAHAGAPDHGHEHVHADGTRHGHPHEHDEHEHEHEHDEHAGGPGQGRSGATCCASSSGALESEPAGHSHERSPDHERSHDHAARASDRAHDHARGHSHAGHSHEHTHGHHHHGGLSDEEHARQHAAEAAQITSWRDLLVLGVTGGIVPCPAGVTLVLYSLTFRSDNTRKAFVYLSSFSLGLGSVLVAIALAMVLSKSYLFRGREAALSRSRAVALLPVGTACLISLVGVGVCWDAFDPGYAKLKAALGLGS